MNKSFATFNLFIDNEFVLRNVASPLKTALLFMTILSTFAPTTSNLSDTVIYLEFIKLFTDILLNV